MLRRSKERMKLVSHFRQVCMELVEDVFVVDGEVLKEKRSRLLSPSAIYTRPRWGPHSRCMWTTFFPVLHTRGKPDSNSLKAQSLYVTELVTNMCCWVRPLRRNAGQLLFISSSVALWANCDRNFLHTTAAV